jgi:hypothetical protein
MVSSSADETRYVRRVVAPVLAVVAATPLLAGCKDGDADLGGAPSTRPVASAVN